MRKIACCIVVALSIVSVTSAQNIKIGVNAGGTFSGFRGLEVPTLNYGPGFGFLGGLTFEYQLSERLSLCVNPAYHRKSNKAKSQYETKSNFDDPWIVHDQTITFNYDYVSMPIMAKYSVGTEGFFIDGGLFVAYLLKSEAKSKSDPPLEGQPDPTISTTSGNNKLDFGLSVGMGKSFQLGGSNALVIELRDDLGFAKINNTNYSGSTINSNALNLIVGWSFNL
jgi:hypothetical protein